MILPRPIPLLPYVYLLCLLEKIDAVIYSGPKGPSSGQSYKHPESDFTIQQVSLTQKGYIQFLRYTSIVPTLTDYTFCIWVRSNNLTYNHPLLSYSKHEEERLIRVWVSERGENLFLEIMEHQIFKVPVNLVENFWYHVCQSWSSQQAAWELFINGKLKSSGFVPKLKGVSIKGGGDIVVGQEYTDFDKGLDDGIEGDVFGFNFVLSSTTTNPIKLANYPLRRRLDAAKPQPQLHTAKPLNIYQPHDISMRVGNVGNHLISGGNNLNAREVFPVRTSVERQLSKRRFARTLFQNMMHLFEAEMQASHIPSPNRFHTKIPAFSHELSSRRISNEITFDGYKLLGLMLVELSFDCSFKKGAPLSGKGVLISWTKSPVRVFGGAILKEIQPFCWK